MNDDFYQDIDVIWSSVKPDANFSKLSLPTSAGLLGSPVRAQTLNSISDGFARNTEMTVEPAMLTPLAYMSQGNVTLIHKMVTYPKSKAYGAYIESSIPIKHKYEFPLKVPRNIYWRDRVYAACLQVSYSADAVLQNDVSRYMSSLIKLATADTVTGGYEYIWDFGSYSFKIDEVKPIDMEMRYLDGTIFDEDCKVFARTIVPDYDASYVRTAIVFITRLTEKLQWKGLKIGWVIPAILKYAAGGPLTDSPDEKLCYNIPQHELNDKDSWTAALGSFRKPVRTKVSCFFQDWFEEEIPLGCECEPSLTCDACDHNADLPSWMTDLLAPLDLSPFETMPEKIFPGYPS